MKTGMARRLVDATVCQKLAGSRNNAAITDDGRKQTERIEEQYRERTY